MLSPIRPHAPVFNVPEPQAPVPSRASTPPPVQERPPLPPLRSRSAPPSLSLGQQARFAAAQTMPIALSNAWAALRQGTNLQALDTVLEHLPSANAQDQKAAAKEFIKHGLKREEEVVLKHLDHLYDSLTSISKSSKSGTKTPLALINALFEYGLNKLPEGQHGAGLSKVSDALKLLSLRNGNLAEVVDLDRQDTKIKEVHELTNSVLSKASLMSGAGILSDAEWSDIFSNVKNSIQLNAVAERAYDLAKVRQVPGERLIDAQAAATLNALKDVENNDAKLMLAKNLLEQLDKIDLFDAPQFLSELKKPLEAMPDKNATAPLIAQINKLQQTQGTSATAS